MRFFLPYADDAETESAYAAIKAFAEETTGWKVSDRRVYRIAFVHEGKPYTAEVGKVTDYNNEEVFAILVSTTYLVCTLNQGVIHSTPILVGHHLVKSREDFA